MATDKNYLDLILDQLEGLGCVTYRPMMGEYVIYYREKVIGGIYDDRFFIKPTEGAKRLMPSAPQEIPYEGAKPMLLPDVDDRELLKEVIEAMYDELPEPKKKKG